MSAAVVLFGVHLFRGCVMGPEATPILAAAGSHIEAEAPYTFAIVGDCRGNTRIFEEILNRIKTDGAQFLVLAGDIVKNCTERDYQWVLHELDEELGDLRLFPVPGNHDINTDSEDPVERYRLYIGAFGPRRYWFSCANTLFVVFDGATAICAQEEIKWLDETLGKLRDRFPACFVCMHVPPRDPRPGRNHALKEGADELIAVLEKHRVTAVFASHIHAYVEDHSASVPVFITGGGGAPLDWPYDGYHYLLCTVEPDGSYNLQRVGVDDMVNTDYPEYVLRVRVPGHITLPAGMAFLVLGLVLWLRRR